MDLAQVLTSTAHRIADHGTRSQSSTLDTIAALARTRCPGAAEALIDWDGSEIARLRAFGIVHRALLSELVPVGDQVQVTRHGTPMSVAV